MAYRWGNNGNSDRLFSWAPKSLQIVTAAMKLKAACSLEERVWQPRQCIKKQRDYFADKGQSSQSYGFTSSHIWMWELDHKERWALKNWCFWILLLEKTLESPLDCKMKPANPKGNQSWIFIGRTDAEAETLILWPPDAKNWLIWKGPDVGERLKVGGEGEDRGWDGWMASPTGWTWVWARSGSWWWTGKPSVLQSMGTQSQTHLSEWTEQCCREKSFKLACFLCVFCSGSVKSCRKEEGYRYSRSAVTSSFLPCGSNTSPFLHDTYLSY